METREELLQKLGEAKRVILKMSNAQIRINQIQNSYQQEKEFRKKSPFKKKRNIIGLVFGIIIGLDIMSSGLEADKMLVISGLFWVVVIYAWKMHRYNKKKLRNAQINAGVEANNIELSIQEDQARAQLAEARKEYNERIATWYPENYCNADAVQFLYNSVSNYRAESLKEAINLYEAELRDRRIEQNYKNNTMY